MTQPTNEERLPTRVLVLVLLALCALALVFHTTSPRRGGGWASTPTPKSPSRVQEPVEAEITAPLKKGGDAGGDSVVGSSKSISCEDGNRFRGQEAAGTLCSPRVLKYNADFNDLGWQWPDASTKDSIWENLERECSKRESTERVLRTAMGKVVGARGDSGRWNRFWLISVDINGRPVCNGGDVYDVSMESEDSKVAVDRVLDIGLGMLEVHVYIRKRGAYTVCADRKLFNIPPENNIFMNKSGLVGKLVDGDFSIPPYKVLDDTMCSRKSWPLDTNCVNGTAMYTTGVDVVPVDVSCTATDDRDRFRFGGWYRLPDGRCDGVHCTGDLPRLKTEGWLWVTDLCKPVLHTDAELKDVLAGRWVLGWGPSTLKQPFSNFVEYRLHHPIFTVTMENLKRWPGKPKRRPGFFSYRQWDVIAPTPNKTTTRWSLQWGGCSNIAARPSECPKQVAMGDYKKVKQALSERFRQRFSGNGVGEWPAALVLDHFVWRGTGASEVAFLKDIDATMDRLNAEFAEAPTKPVMFWHTGPTPRNSRACTAPPSHHLYGHFPWVIEDHVASKHRDSLLLFSRAQMTLPLHFGNTWVHFGLHYGATLGMCMTGGKPGYAEPECVRKTWADDVMVALWMNAMERSFRS